MRKYKIHIIKVATLYNKDTFEEDHPARKSLWAKCILCALNILYPFKNLKTIQDTASKNIGESNRSLDINWYWLLLFIAIPNSIAPKKVLPESPINIFAGCQLKKRKVESDKTNGSTAVSAMEIVAKTINVVEASKPSRQSRKLQKFITPVPTTHKKRNKINEKKLKLSWNNEEK